jgi:hypothetical protein
MQGLQAPLALRLVFASQRSLSSEVYRKAAVDSLLRWQYMRARPLGELALTVISFAVPGLLYSQNLVVAPDALKLLQVEGGPWLERPFPYVPPGQPHGTGPPLRRPATPTTPGSNSARPGRDARHTHGGTGDLAAKRKRGKYQGSIAIKAGAATVTVPVGGSPCRHCPSAFSYLSGPNGCNKADGYRPPLARRSRADLPASSLPGTAYVDPNFGQRFGHDG